jgi:transposase-like protein
MENRSEIKRRRQHSYTEEELQKAIKDVREQKLSVNSVAKKFNIPTQTLHSKSREWKIFESTWEIYGNKLDKR